MGLQATTGASRCTSQALPAAAVPRIPDAMAALSAVIIPVHFISGIIFMGLSPVALYGCGIKGRT
jgi:hypothetical protein